MQNLTWLLDDEQGNSDLQPKSIVQLSNTQYRTFSLTPSVTSPLIVSHTSTFDTFSNILFPETFTFTAPPPQFPTFPPWAMHPPIILLEPCSFLKSSTNAPVYRFFFLGILSTFPGTIPCKIDGSKIGNHKGFAFSTGDQTFAYHHRNSDRSLSIPRENSVHPSTKSIKNEPKTKSR